MKYDRNVLMSEFDKLFCLSFKVLFVIFLKETCQVFAVLWFFSRSSFLSLRESPHELISLSEKYCRMVFQKFLVVWIFILSELSKSLLFKKDSYNFFLCFCHYFKSSQASSQDFHCDLQTVHWPAIYHYLRAMVFFNRSAFI